MNRNALAGLGTMAMFTIACTVMVAVIAAWDSIRVVSPFIVYSLGGLIVSATIAMSVWMLTKAFKPLVDAGMEWVMKYFQIRAMNALINDPNSFVNNAGGIGAAALPTSKIIHPPQIESGIESERPLLQAIGDHKRSLITGSQDGGKTTVLMHLAETKVKQGAMVYALDPHAPPFKWPEGVKVIGAGRGYSDIKEFMHGLFGENAGEDEDCELNRRYNDIYEGRAKEEGHQLIYIVSDEWMTVSQHIGLTMPVKKSFFTETRKASIGYALVSHDVTVDALDVKGVGGLRDDFQSVVTCMKNPRTKEHSIEVRYGFSRNRETERVLPPGPYNFRQTMDEWVSVSDGSTVIDGEYTNTDAPPTITIPAHATAMDVSRPRPRGLSQTICQMYAEGSSFNQIAKVAYGSTGGKQTKRIKEILAAYGRLA